MKGKVILNKGEVRGNVEGTVKANNTFKITNSVKKAKNESSSAYHMEKREKAFCIAL